MNNKTPIDSQALDAAIEELLAGELDTDQAAKLKLAASSDQLMATRIIDAWTIRRGLDELELEIAPLSLEQRLLAIPGKSRKQISWLNYLQPQNWVTGPAWSIAATLCLSLILIIGINRQPSQNEILQARQDIQTALVYLGKSLNQADQFTRDELSLQVQKILAAQYLEPETQSEHEEHHQVKQIDL